jgi:hypothetical protein
MSVRLLCLSALLLSLVVLTACDESLSKLAGPTPNLDPTFASIQRDVFESTDSSGRTSCVTCHTSAGRFPAGGLNLTHDVAYTSLVNRAALTKPGAVRVIPGDISNSYFLQKLRGDPGIVGVRMPFNGPPYLTDGQLRIVERWVAAGAPRN